VANDPKPFASLSSGLLARKGAARPAMRPQGFGQGAAGLEDLGWDDMGFEPPKPTVVPMRDADHDAFGEEIDEQPRVHPSGLTPVQSPVHTQQAEIADRLAGDDSDEEEIDETAEPFDAEAVAEAEAEAAVGFEPEFEPAPIAEQVARSIISPKVVEVAVPVDMPAPRRVPQPRSAPGSKAKAAFTLRLDPQRHLKLRLACAVDGRSAQQIVTAALDHLLTTMPELEAMAEKAKRKG
jgi:hypothetical protein